MWGVPVQPKLRRSLPVRERGLKLFVGHREYRAALASLPVRERGLKHASKMVNAQLWQVAPRAGAWIETPQDRPPLGLFPRRSPCGSVD